MEKTVAHRDSLSQPEGAATAGQAAPVSFTRLSVKHGKSRTAKVWPGRAPATTTVPINRYNCGMTVGFGHYKKFSHTDPAGSPCAVLGWWLDGRVSVELPHGGCGVIGRGDIHLCNWPEYVPLADRDVFAYLPPISMVVDGELQIEG